MIKEVIVVEGKADTVAIRRAVEADTIETGGSAIGEDVLRRIEIAQKRRGVIIFTDPDHAGERIRKIVAARVKGCKHAFLTREEAEGKRNLGVEYASPEVIRRALDEVRSEMENAEPQVTWSDLIDAGLIVHPQAAKRREEVGKLLRIGYANGKQFYKRCVSLQITREELLGAVRQVDNGEGQP
ncbi:ribonuclease M5 [Paenibacillus turpanensis]|uniref:ribonuclease M5 n=1 Tax=Paenibacillus turpanensis TaxID=2689078 RepID=UPI001409E65A|nr:ribonuclease M5 [Paenibacillus turpanensis]